MRSFEDDLCRAALSFLLFRFPMYVLSSGPVLGLGLWLRDVTGWDGFYAVMVPYYPLLELGDGTPLGTSIGWWVGGVFDSSFPG